MQLTFICFKSYFTPFCFAEIIKNEYYYLEAFRLVAKHNLGESKHSPLSSDKVGIM